MRKRSTLRDCYFEASAAYLGVGRLAQQEIDAGRVKALEAAQFHLERAHQMIGRLMEEEPMRRGFVEFFRCLFGMESWRSRSPEEAIADRQAQQKPKS